ncbi:hypothetical protein [Plantibacter sp. CFBP 13570]|uniref:hypothetical protein n=1 Tax=Plantibacter sp. CFBP 13570 TaxID=2775272 RepID=UPI001930943A|nr:hypothetical protein [Plantibacter sp. CFBP 13570]MBD8533821.1 hypothetical protein [Plantibacter sp. CFBP 13570]
MTPAPRYALVILAALFSAYHLLRAALTLETPRDVVPVLIAMLVYAVASVLSLWPMGTTRMPSWLASINLATAIIVPLLVTSQLDPTRNNGYATWHVASIGTLMTITVVRQREAVAYIGIVFLTVQSLLWAGPGLALGMGVTGSLIWVVLASVLTRSIAGAQHDAERLTQAEHATSDWQAAQYAHVHERRRRLSQTGRLATPMLRTIIANGGRLSVVDRTECRTLEASLRDEIRGRHLLSDPVRAEVLAARRRGAIVNMLDEGGLEELDAGVLDAIHEQIAEALAASHATRLIVRSVPDDERVAVTVVGLRAVHRDPGVAAGPDDDDEELDVWLEIPRDGSRAGVGAVGVSDED